jgi:hypothetical protein
MLPDEVEHNHINFSIRTLEYDPEKRRPVFGKEYAQTKN